MIEYLRWRWWLWLAARGERVHWALWRRDVYGVDAAYGSTFRRLIERVSPWVPGEGYRRRRLRQILFRLRHPRHYARFGLLRAARWLIAHLLPFSHGPGRYEEMDAVTAMKAEWLDTHSEWSQDSTGDSDEFGEHVFLFEITPPWSRTVEWWLLTTDTQGFVHADQYGSWLAAWTTFQSVAGAYSRFLTDTGELDVYDPYDHYGTPEHEALLIEEERRGG